MYLGIGYIYLIIQTWHLNSLINIVEQLLGEEVLLTQSDTWCKYGTEDFFPMSNQNQRMHMDYGNNSFLHPRIEKRYPSGIFSPLIPGW